MKTTNKNLWVVGLKVFGIILAIYLVLTVITAVSMAPTSERKEVLQSIIDANQDFMDKPSEVISNPSPAQEKMLKLMDSKAGQEVSRINMINGIVSSIVMVLSAYFAFKYIRSRNNTDNIVRVVTMVVAIPAVLTSLISPAIINSIVGTNGWTSVTYGNWFFWISTILALVFTLLFIGVVVYVINRHHKKKHGFEIE